MSDAPATGGPRGRPGLERVVEALRTALEPTRGCGPPRPDPSVPECPVHDWATSGLMTLTGWPGRPPIVPPGDVMGGLRAVAALLAVVTGELGQRVEVDLATLASGRAALLGLGRRGRCSAGGSCRLLRAADGWLAVNLARPDDQELAIVAAGEFLDPSGAGATDPWSVLGAAAARAQAAALVEQLQGFGVPAGAHPPAPGAPPCRYPVVLRAVPGARPERKRRPLLVADLSAMWAGPLCAHLLGRAGARVVKVESTTRPDGARAGNADFYDGLHAGQESVALDLTAASGQAALRSVLAAADVVVEGSRPRALAQMGVDAEEWVAAGAGRVWVSVTGYGRRGPGANWVAFGDDSAVAGGLVADDGEGPVFCGDALSDPVTGLVAALGAAASLAAGGGHLVEVAMAGAAGLLAGGGGALSCPHHVVPVGRDRWIVRCAHGEVPVARPTTPGPSRRARPMGADTEPVLAELGAGAAVSR